MKKIISILILIFLFSIHLVQGHLAPIVKLPLTQNDYLCTIVGSPGKNMCLFIDHHCNDTIILYNEPIFISQTYTTYPSSILIFFGSHAFRFKAIFDGSYRDPIPYIDNEDGRICFGSMSQIWNHWTKATFSPEFLVLGNYDISLTRETYRSFEIKFEKQYPVNVTVATAQYYLWYDSSTIYTYFPDDLFYNSSLLDLVFDNSHHIHIGIDDTDMMVQNPISLFSHKTIKRHNINDTIVFGRAFTKNFVIFYDAIKQTKWVRPSFDFFNYGSGRNIWIYVLGLIGNLYTLFWIGKVLMPIDPKLSLLGISMLELFIYVATPVVFYVEVFGYATQRFMGFYTETASVILYTSLIIFLMFNASMGAILSVYFWNSTRFLNIRRIFVETAAFSLIWISQLQHTDEGINNIYLLFISSIYAILRFIQMAFAYVHQKKYVFRFSVLYSILSVVLFIYFNARPIIGLYFHDDTDQVSTIILLFLTFVCIPSLYMFFYLKNSEIRHNMILIEKIIDEKKKTQTLQMQNPQSVQFP